MLFILGVRTRKKSCRKTTNFCMQFFFQARLEIKDLFTDLADGKILMKLLEIISGEIIGKPNKGMMRVQKVENVSRCLKFLITKVCTIEICKIILGSNSVGNHFFQTLAKMASGLKLLFAKMKKSSPCLTSHIFFKLANKYQINNTVMFNNLFCRF